jgi:hypothetical protein
MTKKKLVWRFSKLPTVDEIHQLTSGERPILTKDEAKEILFDYKEVDEKDERDKKSLEEEIKFLRLLVEKLSSNRTTVIETIRTIEKPYYKSPWYNPYEIWCGGASVSFCSDNAIGNLTGSGDGSYNFTQNGNFSEIKTF